MLKISVSTYKSKAVHTVALSICKTDLKISLWLLMYSSSTSTCSSCKLPLGQMRYQLCCCGAGRTAGQSQRAGSQHSRQPCHLTLPFCWRGPQSLRKLCVRTQHTDAKLCLPLAYLLLVMPFILGVIFGIAWRHACPEPHALGIVGPSVLTSAPLWGWTRKSATHFPQL